MASKKIIQISPMLTGLRVKSNGVDYETTCIMFGLDDNGVLYELDSNNMWSVVTESPKGA